MKHNFKTVMLGEKKIIKRTKFSIFSLHHNLLSVFMKTNS